MKYLFYVLVMINLVFFIWKFGLEHSESLLQARHDQQLLLPEEGIPPVLEQDAWPSEEPLAEAKAEDPPETSSILPRTASKHGCFEVGPIPTRDKAEAYASLLEPEVKDVRVVIRAGDVPEGWWVLYPKAVTPEAGRANRHMLEGKGIYATWLFDKGPLAGALSLGLYKTRGEADRAVAQLAEKGINAAVAPRLVRGEVYWLKMPWTGLPLELDETIQTLNSRDTTLGMPAPLPCTGKDH